MQRVRMSREGPEFSRMVYGTWRLLEAKPTAQSVNRLLHFCLEQGIRTIDTAEVYGKYEVEALIGQAMIMSPGLRNRFEIVTKASVCKPGKPHPAYTRHHYNATGANLIKCCEKSLRLMGTDRVEMFLVHRPDWLARADDTAAGLNQLLRQGKIRAAGVSNYTPSQFDLLNQLVAQPLATNQVEFSLFRDTPMHDGTLHQCEKAGVLPMIWSPLAGGKLFDPANAAAQRLAELVKQMTARYRGATLDQLAYAWILAHPSRPVPIIGSNKPERIAAAVAALEIKLTREDWYALWEAAQDKKIP